MNISIYILGDTHGNWTPLLSRINYFDIRDCTIIHVGDIGLGFKDFDDQEEELEKINESFKERGINFMGIRGNHDDPQYFDGHYNFTNMDFLPDYTVREIGGRKFQFIGGATSVDRMQRKEDISWWKDEKFDFDPDRCVKCDVLITHSAPSWNGPTDKDPISNWCRVDKDLWSELQLERIEHSRVIELCQPSRHYCGHFHLSSSSKNDGCISRILNIDELLEITHN